MIKYTRLIYYLHHLDLNTFRVSMFSCAKLLTVGSIDHIHR